MPILDASNSGGDRYFQRSPRQATHNFGQTHSKLARNHPRLPFEYYVHINLNHAGGNAAYIKKFLKEAELQQIEALIKSVDMPAMKIETAVLNQYNRKRISQTGVTFEPVKMVCHDVVDGKTLMFWEMYYRYYFADGNEPGENAPKIVEPSTDAYSIDDQVAMMAAGSSTSFVSNSSPGGDPGRAATCSALPGLYRDGGAQ